MEGPIRRSPMTNVGWRPADSGIYVVSECIGASSWYPCNDHPRDKATYSFRSPWTSRTRAANGILHGAGPRRPRTFVFEASEPMASYLATVNIAEFDRFEAKGPRGLPVHLPSDDASEEELGRLPPPGRVLEFLESGPSALSVRVRRRVSRYEQIGGALECQTCRSTAAARQRRGDRARARAPVVRRLREPATVARHVAERGLRELRRVAVDESTDGSRRLRAAREAEYAELRKRKVGLAFDPGVERVFSGACTCAARSCCYGLRKEVGPRPHRAHEDWVQTSTKPTAAPRLVTLASKVAGRDLKPFFDAWLILGGHARDPRYGPVEELPAGGERRREGG
jgi:hypothetical protein